MQKCLQGIFNKDIRALARFISGVENREPEMLRAMQHIYDAQKGGYCLGVTGPPGAGKSTLVDLLIRDIRAKGKTVGVIAIDPSSPFSGGAVLGDRIRMQDHAGDEGVYIRSVGSRGAHGGLSTATRDMVRVLNAFGFDHIIVETVGVGQTELDIMELSDTTVVVLVPEAGDTVQTMKAGLLEIADIFVVNKSDRPGAENMTKALTAMLQLSERKPEWKIPVLATNALKGDGVAELTERIDAHRAATASARAGAKAKLRRDEVIELCLDGFKESLNERMAAGGDLSRMMDHLNDDQNNPYQISLEILKAMGIGR